MKILRLFLCLVLAIFLASSTVTCLCASDGFEIHFLDVGQGDAAVVLCDGKAMLIDGGPPGCSSLLYAYLSDALGLRHIDYKLTFMRPFICTFSGVFLRNPDIIQIKLNRFAFGKPENSFVSATKSADAIQAVSECPNNTVSQNKGIR